MRKPGCLIPVLLAVLLMAGCSQPPEGNVSSTGDQSVENIFTEPETTAETSALPSRPEGNSGNHFSIANEIQKDELGSYLTYEGSEMHLYLRMQITELDDKNIGLLLFVDGRPQPYHSAGNDSLRYMQIFPSGNGAEFVLDLMFTPITGQAGDILEIGFVIVADPGYFIGDAWTGITMADWNGMGLTVRMKYFADPPVAEGPETKDRIISLAQGYIDLTAIEAEMFSSGEYQKEVEYEICVNNRKSFGNIFCVTDGDKLEVEFELKGSSIADFGLVMYLDHEPVSSSEDDIVFIRTDNGKMTIVRAEIDLSGFDGEGVFYAVIVPRNYRTNQLGGSCLLTILGPYYLSGAESLEALRGGD